MAVTDVCALVFNPVPMFELGVVVEVFGTDRTAEGLPGYDFAVVAGESAPMHAAGGLGVQTSYDVDRLATADLVCVAGWRVGHVPPEPALRALREVVARGGRVLSVCSGAFVLAAAGLLDGRRSTTHWKHVDELAAAFPRTRVERDVLYLDEGQVVTAAGTAAGIDACLHVVRQEHGAAVANEIARRMVVPAVRQGAQAQVVASPVPPPRRAGTQDISAVMDWALTALSRPLAVEDMAARASMSSRTFTRRFRDLTGMSPHQWVLARRVDLAQLLLEGGASVEQAARRSGFSSTAALRQHFARSRGTSPSAHARTFLTSG